MSGSSDTVTGRRDPVTGFEDFDEPATAREPVADNSLDERMPARETRSDRAATSAPIVPAGSVTGKSLTLVIVIMCFLACLTAGAVYLVNKSAAAWTEHVAGEVTVQLDTSQIEDKQRVEQRLDEIVAVLTEQSGISGATILSEQENARLLEPWLGASRELATLPLPRLVAIEVDRSNGPDLAAIKVLLSERFPDVVLDDHRHWQSQIRTLTRSLAISGLAILILVGAATTAVIISATRSAMASNREIVEVLHFVGATDRFIAREFEKHFLSLGVKAGLVGAGAAAAVFLLTPYILPLLGGGGPVTDAEVRTLVGTGSLDFRGYGLLGIVVVVVAALCMLTSRYGVFRILHARD